VVLLDQMVLTETG